MFDVALNTRQQLIAHSSRVQTPQRHMSESVLILSSQQQQQQQQHNNASTASWLSRASRSYNQSAANIRYLYIFFIMTESKVCNNF